MMSYGDSNHESFRELKDNNCDGDMESEKVCGTSWVESHGPSTEGPHKPRQGLLNILNLEY